MIRFGRGNGFRHILAGMTLAVCAWFVPTASAQFGDAAGIGEAMQPDYYRRDVVLISQGLKMDESQRAILHAMFDDYTAAFEAGLEGMKAKFEGMRDELQQIGDSDRERIMKVVFQPFRQWNVEKADLGTQFLANIEVVLNEEQLQLWPAVQRRLYRERNLHKGRLAGESVNLLDAIRDLNLDQRISLQVQPIVEAYEVALDVALRSREEPLTKPDNLMLKSIEEQDSKKGEEALRQHIQRQIAVRNVNDEYIEKIATVLPADLAQQFRTSALERAYPRVYRETPVQRIFKVARDLESLEPSTRGTVIMLEAEMLAELAVVNSNLMQGLRAWEPQELQERAVEFARRMDGLQVEPKKDPTRDLFVKREEMFRGYIKRLKSMLTVEQFDQLPGAYRWIDPPPAVEAEPAPRRSETKKPEKDFGSSINEMPE